MSGKLLVTKLVGADSWNRGGRKILRGQEVMFEEGSADARYFARQSVFTTPMEFRPARRVERTPQKPPGRRLAPEPNVSKTIGVDDADLPKLTKAQLDNELRALKLEPVDGEVKADKISRILNARHPAPETPSGDGEE